MGIYQEMHTNGLKELLTCQVWIGDTDMWTTETKKNCVNNWPGKPEGHEPTRKWRIKFGVYHQEPQHLQ